MLPSGFWGDFIKLRVCLLGSGSGGNSAYIGIPAEGKEEGIGLLIDAGLSSTQILSRLRAIQVDIREIKGILITHEHQDHVAGADVLGLTHQVPIYANEATRRAAKTLRKLPVAVHAFETGLPFKIGPFYVHPFPISHDAADPVGFSIQTDRHKVGMVTDLGSLTPSLDRLSGCDLLILESNYDTEMLANGPYPNHLKKRVSGNQGHLSNSDSALLLRRLLHSKLQHLFLAHLSQKNNLPELACQTAQEILKKEESATQLHLAWQDFLSPVVTLS
jgi:phosphoribosyl 1,2-cyclic phosphodiesterase